MTPKSMLRNKRAVSPLDRFRAGHVVPPHPARDQAETRKGEKIKLAKDDKIRRVVICVGQGLLGPLRRAREARHRRRLPACAVEQLYPFPLKQLVRELSRFKKAEVVWCQEEPKNMGAWTFVEPYHRMGARPGRRQVEARALRRPSGGGGDRDRPDVEASRPAQGVPRRMLRVRRGDGGPMAHFLCKLMPPRPTFLVRHDGGRSAGDAARIASTGRRRSRSAW